MILPAVLLVALTALPEPLDAACPAVGTTSGGSLLQRIEACEVRVASAPPAERQRMLVAIGSLSEQLEAWTYRCRAKDSNCPAFEESPDEVALSRYAKTHEGAWAYEGPGEQWHYTGIHYRQAVDVDPGTPLAEEAAWRRYRLSDFGECPLEGGCEPLSLVFRFKRIAEYLGAFPTSKRSADVLAEANRRFKAAASEIVARAAQQPPPVEPLDSTDWMPKLVDEYDALTRSLPVRQRAAACDALADMALALKDPAKGKVFLACAARSPDATVAKRARDRLAKLPK